MNTNEPVTGHRTQIYLPESLYRLIIEKANKEEVSMAQIIRKIIEKSIIKEEKKNKKNKDKAWKEFFRLAGIGDSGLNDISTNHDKYLAEDLYQEHQEEIKQLKKRQK